MSASRLITHHKVAGFEAFLELAAQLATSGQPINAYFSGSVDTTTGISWCPDCVEAEPHVKAALERVTEPAQFVYIDVGDRAFWKDPKNVFRTDRRTHLSVIPALLRWGDVRRLEGEQLLNAELLDMFFNED